MLTGATQQTIDMAHRPAARTHSLQTENKSAFMRTTGSSAISTQRKKVTGLRNGSIEVTLKGAITYTLLPLFAQNDYFQQESESNQYQSLLCYNYEIEGSNLIILDVII